MAPVLPQCRHADIGLRQSANLIPEHVPNAQISSRIFAGRTSIRRTSRALIASAFRMTAPLAVLGLMPVVQRVVIAGVPIYPGGIGKKDKGGMIQVEIPTFSWLHRTYVN